jgi:hypothetical protein
MIDSFSTENTGTLEELMINTPKVKTKENKGKRIYAIYAYLITIGIKNHAYRLTDYDNDRGEIEWKPKDNDTVFEESISRCIRVSPEGSPIWQFMYLTALFDPPEDQVQLEIRLIDYWTKNFDQFQNDPYLLPKYNAQASSLVKAIYVYMIKKGE